MQPKDLPLETPSQPRASVLRDQLEANEMLVLAALRAQEAAEEAHSSRSRAEKESVDLRLTAAELVATGELRELLLGIIGHDLRNPLSTINVAAQLLLEGKSDPGRQSWLVTRIIDSSQRMGRMIDQLAAFTRVRLGSGLLLNLHPCDLAKICEDVASDLRLGSGAEILLDVSHPLNGDWDSDRVTELLSNLVGNAIDHAAKATAVRIRAYSTRESVVVEVENQGVCIPPESIGSIFHAFRRAEENNTAGAGHLGLGLYICREIALLHGGSLEVISADSKTIFTVSLPRIAS